MQGPQRRVSRLLRQSCECNGVAVSRLCRRGHLTSCTMLLLCRAQLSRLCCQSPTRAREMQQDALSQPSCVHPFAGGLPEGSGVLGSLSCWPEHYRCGALTRQLNGLARSFLPR